MTPTSYKAIVFGSTGATGSVLIHQLVHNNQFTNVTAATRKSIPNLYQRFGLINNNDTNKLNELIIDYDHITDDIKQQINEYDVVFCTLGTTKAHAGSAEQFRLIDYQYVMNIAQSINSTTGTHVKHFIYQSSQGANEHSTLLYPRTKGELERDLLKHTTIKYLTILRPGLLLTNRINDNRVGERIAQYVYPIISSIFPSEYKSVDTRSVAARMIIESLDQSRRERYKLVTNGVCVNTKWPTDADWKL